MYVEIFMGRLCNLMTFPIKLEPGTQITWWHYPDHSQQKYFLLHLVPHQARHSYFDCPKLYIDLPYQIENFLYNLFSTKVIAHLIFYIKLLSKCIHWLLITAWVLQEIWSYARFSVSPQNSYSSMENLSWA